MYLKQHMMVVGWKHVGTSIASSTYHPICDGMYTPGIFIFYTRVWLFGTPIYFCSPCFVFVSACMQNTALSRMYAEHCLYPSPSLCRSSGRINRLRFGPRFLEPSAPRSYLARTPYPDTSWHVSCVVTKTHLPAAEGVHPRCCTPDDWTLANAAALAPCLFLVRMTTPCARQRAPSGGSTTSVSARTAAAPGRRGRKEDR